MFSYKIQCYSVFALFMFFHAPITFKIKEIFIYILYYGSIKKGNISHPTFFNLHTSLMSKPSYTFIMLK